jgi:hypothetical protein
VLIPLSTLCRPLTPVQKTVRTLQESYAHFDQAIVTASVTSSSRVNEKVDQTAMTKEARRFAQLQSSMLDRVCSLSIPPNIALISV